VPFIKLDGFCFYHHLSTASTSKCFCLLPPRKNAFLTSYPLIAFVFADRGVLLVRGELGWA
jgi:hypothetical protein